MEPRRIRTHIESMQIHKNLSHTLQCTKITELKHVNFQRPVK
jgi:hypothetical protein